MAAIRVGVLGVTDIRPSSVAGNVGLVCSCKAVDTAGGSFQRALGVETTVAITDTLAVIQGKIIDSLVASAAALGHTLARTDVVFLFTIARGS